MAAKLKSAAQVGIVGTVVEQTETVLSKFEQAMIARKNAFKPEDGYFWTPSGRYHIEGYVLREAEPEMKNPQTQVKEIVPCVDMSFKVRHIEGNTLKVISALSAIERVSKQFLAIAKKHGFNLDYVAPLGTAFSDLPWMAPKDDITVEVRTFPKGTRTLVKTIMEV
jgi:RNase P/RNase MRP subunit p29